MKMERVTKRICLPPFASQDHVDAFHNAHEVLNDLKNVASLGLLSSKTPSACPLAFLLEAPGTVARSNRHWCEEYWSFFFSPHNPERKILDLMITFPRLVRLAEVQLYCVDSGPSDLIVKVGEDQENELTEPQMNDCIFGSLDGTPPVTWIGVSLVQPRFVQRVLLRISKPEKSIFINLSQIRILEKMETEAENLPTSEELQGCLQFEQIPISEDASDNESLNGPLRQHQHSPIHSPRSSESEKILGKYTNLTLTTSSVEVYKASFPHFVFKSKISPSDGFSSNDEGEAGQKLAQELNKELASIQVNMSCVGRDPDNMDSLYDLTALFLDSSGECSIMGKLKNRFQEDSILISVELTPILARQCGPVVFAKQMDITSVKNACKTRLPPVSNFLPHFIEMTDKWKLTVEISAFEFLETAYAVNGISLVSDSSLKFDEPQVLQMLDEECYTDVTIFAGNGAQIKAHKMYLAAATPVLHETLKNSTTDTLDMKDMSEGGVRAFLRYLYGKELAGPKEDVQVAFELLQAAYKYRVSKLEMMMEALLEEEDEKDFGVVLAFKMYCFVRCRKPFSELKDKAIRILMYKWDELEATKELRDLFKGDTDSVLNLCRDMAKSQVVYCDQDEKVVNQLERENTKWRAMTSSWKARSEELIELVSHMESEYAVQQVEATREKNLFTKKLKKIETEKLKAEMVLMKANSINCEILGKQELNEGNSEED